MTGAPLYTLREIAQQLGVPESTARYYRDAFAAYVPTVGRGRRRRYPPEAAEVLGEIASLYADGRSREAIEAALGGPVATPVQEPVAARAPVPTAGTDIVAAMLEGERERREIMWEMVREIVRLGEAVERQHVILSGIADQLIGRAERALPSPREPTGTDDDAPARTDDEITREIAALREELERERQLVERLRRSKLDLERRAARAEELLEERDETAGRPSLLDLLRARAGPGEDR